MRPNYGFHDNIGNAMLGFFRRLVMCWKIQIMSIVYCIKFNLYFFDFFYFVFQFHSLTLYFFNFYINSGPHSC
jgi:hypothetical protein